MFVKFLNFFMSKLNVTLGSYAFSLMRVPAMCSNSQSFVVFFPSHWLTARSSPPPTCLSLTRQRLRFTRPRPQMRRPSLVQRGNWAGFSSPGRETLSSCLSSASLANTSYWPCWISPVKDDACLCWVSAAFQTLLNEQIFTLPYFFLQLYYILF